MEKLLNKSFVLRNCSTLIAMTSEKPVQTQLQLLRRTSKHDYCGVYSNQQMSCFREKGTVELREKDKMLKPLKHI